jgi:hypothetical protein
MIFQVFPLKRKFHSCILIDNYAYLFGGMHSDFERNLFCAVDNLVWRLDLDELRWQRLNIKMPVLTYFHAACATNVFSFILEISSFLNNLKKIEF